MNIVLESVYELSYTQFVLVISCDDRANNNREIIIRFSPL